MTEKRFTHDWSVEFEREVVIDHDNSDYEMMEKQCCDLLNEQHETITTYKAIIDKQEMQLSELEYNQQKVKDTLQKHYDTTKNGMEEMAKQECWSGYGAFKLEYGQVKLIAKDLGIDLQ